MEEVVDNILLNGLEWKRRATKARKLRALGLDAEGA